MVPARSLALLVGVVVVMVGGGCERTVEPACEAYVACQQAYDTTTGVPPADTTRYADPWSDCWGVDQRARDRCVAECQEAQLVLQEAILELDLDVPACDDDDSAGAE